MPDPQSADLVSLEQQRKRAKDLIRAARAGDADALARLRAVRPDAATPARPPALADAQYAVAREAGFPSWPALVSHVHARDVEAFREAVRRGDVARVQRLVTTPHVRARINDPMFDFGQRAAHLAARNEALLGALVGAGADLALRSEWANGPFTVLDNADAHTARVILGLGAPLTAHVAARLGWADDLQRLVAADPSLVHARGGDGQQPLHAALTVAIADFLLDRGAQVDARCVDHSSTPAQYALVDRPDVCRRLLERGATPDIYMAARLGDVPLATRLIAADPSCLTTRVNAAGYPPVPPMSIYCWSIGFGRSPHEVAARFGQAEVLALLSRQSPSRVRLMNAVLSGNEAAARAIADEDPGLLSSLTREEHGHLAHAIFHERFDAADVMLTLGFDPTAPGADGGTALHAACWVGSVRMVERLVAHGGVPLDARDPTHGSTPLGWTAFGSVHRRATGADYAGVAQRLVDAGADIHAVGNRLGRSLLAMSQGDPAMQEALRRLGAR